ncbi:hypothetical protein [Acidiphilium multivorum]|uniref:hypothetical protein n=1 Tax=Acidiphilium multivorum TaxID=62140 RepID=UPI001F4C41DB|nr:hypothetical protein [Acidiphilium multivorum]
MLCKTDVDFEHHINNFINIVSKSPRELVRLFDVLVREYDVKYAQENHIQHLSNDDFQDAIESYIKNVVWTVYDRKNLSEILRLGMQRFINKDVQTAFKISDQGARNRIRNWISAGAVRQAGTTAGESETGGKPANVYTISDPRISIMLERSLYDRDALIVEAVVDDE